MSTYYSSSITIKIPEENFDWLDRLIENIYNISDLYVQPLDHSLAHCANKLEMKNARDYFKHYITELQTNKAAIDDLPSIVWDIRDSLRYTVVLSSEPGYLRWIIYLSNSIKIPKYSGGYDIDFEYYLRKLLALAVSFPIIRVWAGCDEEYGDPEWFALDGYFWPFKIKNPQPDNSFQMLSVLIAEKLQQDLFVELIEQAHACGYQFFPDGLSLLQSCQEVVDSIVQQKEHPRKWIYVCGNVMYKVDITLFEGGYYTRLLFQTQESKDTPSLEFLVDHALILTLPYVVDQVRSFDSRYNYLSPV